MKLIKNLIRWKNAFVYCIFKISVRFSSFISNWIFSTNHRRIAVLYFIFILITGVVGLTLATIIRLELAYPGQYIFCNNAEKYLTVAAIHGIVMVFFVVIPALFGGLANFLLPTQLGIRDVAFPRLNSFMYWITPAGFVLLLHTLLFDKSYTATISLHQTMQNNFKNFNKTPLLKTYKTSISNSAININESEQLTQTSLWLMTSAKYVKNWQKQHKTYRDYENVNHDLSINLPVETWFYTETFNPAKQMNIISLWHPSQLIPGWAFITPYSSRLQFAALGKVDIALIVVLISSLGSTLSAVNYVITYRYISAPTMRSRKELRSFFTDGLLVGSRMMLLANPALIVGILLLLSDRHLNTSVFDFSGGGDTILFQHLFWFFGHPEVYIIIIPCFGLVNSLLPYYTRKRLSGRLSLQFSMYTIAFMSFAVWGHHMYMVGLANSVRTLYSTMTVMISVPASTKVLHWCVTLLQSSPVVDVGFIFLLSFLYFFVLGGLSGMFNAHMGFDVICHDTFYVIGHFHVILSGAVMSIIFCSIYMYFPAITGLKYSRFFGYLHVGFYIIGQLFTLIPMFWMGYAGMPRRVMDYPSAFGGWHSISSAGHLLTVMSILFFFLMLLDSFYENRASYTKTRGVSRLNVRLAFYTYEIRKIQSYRAKGLFLARTVRPKKIKILNAWDVTCEQLSRQYYIANSENFDH